MALTGTIDNYPGFEDGIDGFTLGMKMQKCAERFGAKTENTEVICPVFMRHEFCFIQIYKNKRGTAFAVPLSNKIR